MRRPTLSFELMRKTNRLILVSLLASVTGVGAAPGSSGDDLDARTAFLRTHGRTPTDYVVSKLQQHQIVILGESHWIRHDVELVAQLVRQYGGMEFELLASEFFPASMQQRVDSLITANEWDRALGISVLRVEGWPYEEYLDILKATWEVNRAGRRLRLVALSPGPDWRETILPKGETYDAFMARLILDAAPDDSVRVVAYMGYNHAFTRYHQPDSWRGDRVLRFMDRTGNVLWRARGERVVMIALNPPFLCREGDHLRLCTPVEGMIDCAASAAGSPVGFSLADSPFADIPVRAHYATGHRSLVLADLADGWIWQRSADRYETVQLIPLEDYAPGPAELAEALAHNPFGDEGDYDREGLRVLWGKAQRDMSDYASWHGWSDAAAWKQSCADPLSESD